MIILFIGGLLLGAVAVMFALQNVEVVTVAFFSWQLTGSLALILSIAILSGVLIAILLVLPGSISSYFKYNRIRKENMRLEEELRKKAEKGVFSEKTPPTRQEIRSIENGASSSGRTI